MLRPKFCICYLLMVFFLTIPSLSDDIDKYIVELQDQNAPVRQAAATALNEIIDPRIIEPMILALNDEDSAIRGIAADTLGNLGDTKAVDPLILALMDNDSAVRLKAIEALERLNDTRAVNSEHAQYAELTGANISASLGMAKEFE